MKPKIAAGVIALALAGCSSPLIDPVETPDPPITKGVEYLNFGTGYYSIAMVCDGHGHRVYQPDINSSAGRQTVIDDPTCPGGKEER